MAAGASVALLRRLHVIRHGRASADEVAVAVDVVDAGDGGPLLTPPLSCGLLAGVLRGEMLETGKAAEAVLTVEDLQAAKALFVGNSLRGLIRARLA